MAYGMTEAIGITALDGGEWLAHEGSVGRGVRGTEVRILDASGQDVPAGVVGEVFLRSPSYGGSTYLGEAPQLHTTGDGFSTVGDMGYLDEDGYLDVVDRRVDMIVTGGANVFPAEVEAALIDHTESEYFLTGTANSYRQVGTWGSDGRWAKAVDGAAQPFTTRLLVDRPADPPGSTGRCGSSG